MSARARAIAFAGAALLVAAAAHAGTTADRPAAVLVYPQVRVDRALGIDTTVQLSNDADHPVDARCFYEIAERNCVGGEAGESCAPPITCSGQCVVQLRRLPFRVRLTSGQPLAWPASTGLAALPLDGTLDGPGGENNLPTEVSPLGDGPISAVLRCVVVAGDSLDPLADNALVGLATVTRQGDDADATQYRAIGVPARTIGDGDDALQLGGPQPEYEACPAANQLDFFFTGGPLATGPINAEIGTDLVLTTCGATADDPRLTIAQFLVFNEFGQRFSTSLGLNGQLATALASIDSPGDPTRSIFSVRVAGTLAGRVQIVGTDAGLLALAFETHRDRASDVARSTAVEVLRVGERTDGDRLLLPAPPCPGDCDRNGVVSIDELVTGVGIAIGQGDAARCRGGDRNGNGQIAINELVASVAASLEGCPAAHVLPTATPRETPTPEPSQPPSDAGPEITFLGLATADDQPLTPDEIDDQGRPVYVRPHGEGFTLVIEARRGTSRRPVGGRTYDASGGAPDVQVLASLPLGDGDAAVCEDDGARGGIPAVPDLAFSDAPATVAAMNDLGCRAYNRQGGLEACTRATGDAPRGALFAFTDRASEAQFCIPIARAWALPAGASTSFAARVRDASGTFGPPREMVVRVPAP